MSAPASRNRDRVRVGIIMPGLVSARISFLNKLVSSADLDAVVFLMNRVQVGRTEADLPYEDIDFDCKVLSSLTLPHRTRGGDTWPVHINPALHLHIARGKFDAIVALQWTALYTAATVVQMKVQRRPVLLWEESISHPSGPMKQALAPALRRLFGAFDACIAASSRCRDYLIEMGARAEGVFVAGTPIDTEFFAGRSIEISSEAKQALKRDLALEGKQVIVFIGQLIPRKGVMVLLRAFVKLREQRPNAALVMLGSGALLDEINQFVNANALEDAVRVIGFVQHAQLQAYCSMAEVFVLPSLYDAFPVAVHEAMACGLPVITTDMVGVTPDLVKDGVNGFVVPAGDDEALSCALNGVLQDDKLRARMAEASREVIAGWTIENAVGGFRQAIDYALTPAVARP
jgi:glycosyltransferase involved in cell wall biosynthesis